MLEGQRAVVGGSHPLLHGDLVSGNLHVLDASGGHLVGRWQLQQQTL